jgi:hypothetical protein
MQDNMIMHNATWHAKCKKTYHRMMNETLSAILDDEWGSKCNPKDVMQWPKSMPNDDYPPSNGE